MKVTNRQLWDSQTGLKVLIDKELPAKTSYSISRNLKTIGKELELIEEKRKELVKKFAEESGKTVAQEKMDDFQKEFNEIMNLEVDLDLWKVKIDTLGNVAPSVLSAVDFLIEE